MNRKLIFLLMMLVGGVPVQAAESESFQVLKQRLEALEKKLETKEAPRKKSSFPLDISLSVLLSGGGSSADNDELSTVQAGGHDPNKNGFTLQNVELSLSATVDPYFDGQANLIYLIDAEGETVVELEEAFLVSRSLPSGLQLKAGQYFTEFGRQNVQHPHIWAFVDQPVVLSRFFGGDGLRSQGLRLSWLTPLPWFSEWILGAQNAKGETVISFLGAAGEDVGGYVLQDRQARTGSDLLYSARWLNSFELTDAVALNVGVSGLKGPNATGLETETEIIGADLYIKWQPARSQKGYPFIAFHSEYLERKYEAGDLPSQDILEDRGSFTQLLWGFTPGWIAGIRSEAAEARTFKDVTDPFRDRRRRGSVNLTWRSSEYSKIRLQYNHDRMEHLPDDEHESWWLQTEVSLGSHKAHSF